MGTESISLAIGRQCAPLLVGIKPSNLLILERGYGELLDEVLAGSGMCRHLLYTSQAKDYWFVFEEQRLREVMNQREHAEFLNRCGYALPDPADEEKMIHIHGAACEASDLLSQVLHTLRQRFAAYKMEEAEFPHEMGVLLGYPLNDVLGFIRHKGRDFKLSGYWKVYDNVTYADWMFRLYENAKTLVLQMCRQGFLIPEICEVCRMEAAALLQG